MAGLLSAMLWTSSAFQARAEPPFDALRRLVSGRTGKEVRWIRGAAEDEEVAAALQRLLRRELTADSAVQVALLNNRQLQARFEQIGIAQADLVQAGLLSNPQFAANWRFPDRPPSATDAEYSISQDFLDLLILPLRKRVAARELERTTMSVADSVLSLAAEVKSAFYTLEAQEQLLKGLRTVASANSTAAEFSKRLHDAGNVDDLALAEQQADSAQSHLGVAQAEARIRSDREKLNRLMGLSGPETDWRTAGQLPEIPGHEISTRRLESLAVSQRLDLKAALLDVNTAAQALSLRQKTRFLPAGISLGIDTELSPDRQRVTGPTLALQLPLFDRGQGAIPRLEAQYRQAEFSLEALVTNVRSEVREARDRLLAEREAAEYARKVLVPERERIVDLMQQQYNFMLKSAFDLLIARQNQVDSQRNFIEASRDYWIARSDLERAVGGSLGSRKTSPQPRSNTNKP